MEHLFISMRQDMDKYHENSDKPCAGGLISKTHLPEGFLFGVANSGYQVEGGYNRQGCPHNNLALWEQEGRVEPTGDACRFWEGHDEHIELARNLGLNAFRMSIEWARVQPSYHCRVSTPPPLDEEAIAGYASILSKIVAAGLTPIVTLHHFTHPAWCGMDLWLQDGMAYIFVDYAARVILEINKLLIRAGNDPLHYILTINEPDILALSSYMAFELPHARWGFSAARQALDTMLMAHVLLYDRIHDLYEEKGWPEPVVFFNTFACAVYEFDRALFDIMRAPVSGVSRGSLKDYLAVCRQRWNNRFDDLASFRWGRHSLRRLYFLDHRFFCSILFDPLYMKRTIDALYTSHRREKLDAVALDIYDPFVIGEPYIRLKKQLTNEPMFRRQWWGWRHDPVHFRTVIHAHNEGNFGLPIHIMETTLAHRQKRGGNATPRRDGQGREDYLKWSIREVIRAVKDGIPLKSYIYWSLTDNYEWGSFEPRLGLFEYDFDSGLIKHLSGLSEDAGGLYGAIVKALRQGDAAKVNLLLGL